MFAEFAESLHFVETHVRCRYLENVVVEHDAVEDCRLLICIEIVEEYGEHIAEFEDLVALLPVEPVVDYGLLALVPERGQKLCFEAIGLCRGLVLAFFVANHF